MESAVAKPNDNQVANLDSISAPELSAFHFHTVPVLIFTLLIILLTSGAFFLGQKYASLKQYNHQVVLIPTAFPTALPAINPTENWKTYANNKYKFSLKYPFGWQVLTSPVNSDQFNIIISPEDKSDERGIPPIQISINMAKDLNGNTFTSISDAEAILTKSFSKSSIIKKNSMIDNQSAVSLTGLLIGPGPSEGRFLHYTLIQYNNKVIFTQLGNKDYQNIFDQILSTFKFL